MNLRRQCGGEVEMKRRVVIRGKNLLLKFESIIKNKKMFKSLIKLTMVAIVVATKPYYDQYKNNPVVRGAKDQYKDSPVVRGAKSYDMYKDSPVVRNSKSYDMYKDSPVVRNNNE